MITVRFLSGFSIRYNMANFVMRMAHGYTDLYTKKGGTWIAQVPTAACVVEAVPACLTYNASNEPDELRNEVHELRRSIESLKRRLAKAGKA